MIQVYLRSIDCTVETDEDGADEPYVIVAAVDFTSTQSLAINTTIPVPAGTTITIPFPTTRTVLYGPFEGVNEGQTAYAPGIRRSFWGLTGAPRPLTSPASAFFMVGLLDQDDGRPNVLRTLVNATIAGSLAASATFPLPQLQAALLRDFDDALDTPTGAPSTDERIGAAQALLFTAADMANATFGQRVAKILTFSGDGADYYLTFEMRVAWREWFTIAAASVPAPGLVVTPLKPRPGHINLFLLDGNGVFINWWAHETGWHDWWEIPGSRFLGPATVTALAPHDDHIDLFACDREGVVWSTWWESGPTWLPQWFSIHPNTRPRASGILPRPPEVTAIIPRAGHIDLFLADHTGTVWSTWWEEGPDWQPWFPIAPGPTFQPGATVTAYAWPAGHIDLFVTDATGIVWTSRWLLHGPDWQAWQPINGVRAQPGATVTALVPREGHIDLFVTDGGGRVWSNWQEGPQTWRGWFPIGGSFVPGVPIAALAPSQEHVDLFAADGAGNVWTTYWEPATNWQPWFRIGTAPQFQPGARVTALIPRDNHIDLFTSNAAGVWSNYWDG